MVPPREGQKRDTPPHLQSSEVEQEAEEEGFSCLRPREVLHEVQSLREFISHRWRELRAAKTGLEAAGSARGELSTLALIKKNDSGYREIIVSPVSTAPCIKPQRRWPCGREARGQLGVRRVLAET